MDAPVFPRRGVYALTPDDVDDIDMLLRLVERALDGGVAVVQYRDKRRAAGEQLRRATALTALCHARGVPLIVNDSAEVAIASGAAGVHIGRDDGDVAAARRLLGPGRVLGVSCYASLELARSAVADGADYIAFGSMFASASKPQAPPCPLTILRAAAAEFAVPVVAIGGITPENASALVAAGAGLLAVIGAIFGAQDPATAARAFAPVFASSTSQI